MGIVVALGTASTKCTGLDIWRCFNVLASTPLREATRCVRNLDEIQSHALETAEVRRMVRRQAWSTMSAKGSPYPAGRPMGFALLHPSYERAYRSLPCGLGRSVRPARARAPLDSDLWCARPSRHSAPQEPTQSGEPARPAAPCEQRARWAREMQARRHGSGHNCEFGSSSGPHGMAQFCPLASQIGW